MITDESIMMMAKSFRHSLFVPRRLLMHARDALFQRDETEIGECLDQIGYVVMAMGNRVGARRRNDLDVIAELPGGERGDLAERRRYAGCHVERADAFAEQASQRQRGNVVDMDMVACFFAAAAERNLALF